MEIIKHLINIKINMLRYSNINLINQIRELTATHMLFHSNMLRHFMTQINIMFRQQITTISREIKLRQPATNIKIKKLLCLFFGLVMFSSCSSDKYDNDSLYSSVGFEQGSMPMQGQQKVAPDYFYRQAQGAMGGGAYPQGGGAPAYPQQQYQQPQQPPQYPPQYQPQPQQQYYPQTYGTVAPYQVYPNAGSRFYSNPYAIPPSPYYPQYDVDQYYVPPTYSYGIEQSGAPSNRPNNSR